MKKEFVTPERIERDIIDSFGVAKNQTWRQYRVWLIVTLICAVALLVTEWFYPTAVLWCLVAFAVMIALVFVFYKVRLIYRKKHFCMDDYEITVETLYDKQEDHYMATMGRHRSRQIDNYDLYFTNGKDWRIPDKNYLWSAEYQLSDQYIYKNAHRGDKFIAVSKKDTGEIAMAYPTDYFVYKEI